MPYDEDDAYEAWRAQRDDEHLDDVDARRGGFCPCRRCYSPGLTVGAARGDVQRFTAAVAAQATLLGALRASAYLRLAQRNLAALQLVEAHGLVPEEAMDVVREAWGPAGRSACMGLLDG